MGETVNLASRLLSIGVQQTSLFPDLLPTVSRGSELRTDGTGHVEGLFGTRPRVEVLRKKRRDPGQRFRLSAVRENSRGSNHLSIDSSKQAAGVTFSCSGPRLGKAPWFVKSVNGPS